MLSVVKKHVAKAASISFPVLAKLRALFIKHAGAHSALFQAACRKYILEDTTWETMLFFSLDPGTQ